MYTQTKEGVKMYTTHVMTLDTLLYFLSKDLNENFNTIYFVPHSFVPLSFEEANEVNVGYIAVPEHLAYNQYALNEVHGLLCKWLPAYSRYSTFDSVTREDVMYLRITFRN
jgi:hypothetical protein